MCPGGQFKGGTSHPMTPGHQHDLGTKLLNNTQQNAAGGLNPVMTDTQLLLLTPGTSGAILWEWPCPSGEPV